MQKMSSEQFIELITGRLKKKDSWKSFYKYSQGIKSDPVFLSGIEVEGPIELEGKLCDTIILENVVFTHTLIFGACITSELIIDGGTFRGKATYEWESLKVTKDAQIQYLRIQNGDFKKLVIIENDHDSEIFINDGVFFGNVLIEGKWTNISFNGGIFHSQVMISGKCIENLLFNGGKFESIVSIRPIQVKSLILKNGLYGAEFFCKESVIDELKLLGGTFQSLTFRGNEYIDIVIISAINVSDILSFQVNRIRQFTLGDSGITKLRIIGGGGCQALVRDLDIKNAKDFFLGVENVHISKLSLSDIILSRGSGIVFTKIRFNQIEFSSFINLGIIHFHSTDVLKKKFECGSDGIQESVSSPVLTLFNSDLGKTTFIHSKFESFENFFFANSRISQCFFGGTEFPNKIQTDPDSNLFEQEMLSYGQLKKLYESRGDVVQSNRFFAYEMESYLSYLKSHDGYGWEKLNLYFNKYSNQHGQSWSRALIAILSVGGLSYFFFLISVGIYPVRPNSHAWDLFWEISSKFFLYINPVHRMDFLGEKVELRPFSYLIDSLTRITMSYLIYQLVQAFRRYGKKS